MSPAGRTEARLGELTAARVPHSPPGAAPASWAGGSATLQAGEGERQPVSPLLLLSRATPDTEAG